MGATLLIVDEAGRRSALAALLERHGHHCHCARGPLRVRELLAREPVQAIVWRESPARPGLAPDLAEAWSRLPHLPVLHLYPAQSGAGREPTQPLPPQVMESLPATAAEAVLLAALGRVLEAAESRASAAPLPRTELVFRNVLHSLRDDLAPERAGPGAADEGAIPSPGTALQPPERDLLAPRREASTRSARTWQWLRRKLHG